MKKIKSEKKIKVCDGRGLCGCGQSYIINRRELSGWESLTLEAGRVTTLKCSLTIRRYYNHVL